ncbi:MAG: NAD(P)H-binding protein [Halioglobus sp.]|nr:NAD(P)H-binding protein [Halioglobus sp.]
MGGTGFIGPHMVRALVASGYDVTLFNRGKTNPHLFPNLKKIRGDRTTPEIARVAGEKWDLVVDTSCYIPRAVDLLMAALDTESVRQYVLISTVLVYSDFSEPGLHEGSTLARMDGES